MRKFVKSKLGFTIYPSPQISNAVVEPYKEDCKQKQEQNARNSQI